MLEANESLGPFSERNGVNASMYTGILLAPPEIQLSQQEKEAAFAFADGLVRGYLDESLRVETGAGEMSKTLAEIDQISIGSSWSDFYLDYFTSAESESDGVSLGLDAHSKEPLANQLYALAVNPPGSKIRQTVAANSKKWYKAKLARQLELDPSNDSDQPDSEVISVDFEPDKLLDKFADLQAYRKFHHRVSRQLRLTEPTNLVLTEQVLLDIHRAKVNSLAAGLYPRLVALAEQLQIQKPNAKTAKWQEKLTKIAPVVPFEPGIDGKFGTNFKRNLDFIRNGAESYAGQSDFSPISRALGNLAAELEVAGEASNPEAELPPEVIKMLENIKWGASQLQSFLEAVLAGRDLLSEQKTDWHEASERSGAASDNKWQVVTTPKVSSLSVDGSKKIMKVPADLDRTIAETLPKAAHELAHVLQHVFADELSKKLPLAKINGRRYVTSYEMGGILEEREVLAKLGQSRPTNLTYLRALEVKLAGGNQTEVARAFADARKNPDKYYKSAGSNILRLYRHGGYDSQALDYAEQELQRRALTALAPDEAREIAIAGASFSLADSAALHRADLLDLPQPPVWYPAEEVLGVFIAKFYDQLG